MRQIFGYLENQRRDFDYRPVAERLKDSNEIMKLQNNAVLEKQGSRCMDCGVPFCNALGCSLGNLIPEWNELVQLGYWHEAYQRLALTSNFPEFTGRVCPAPCESACTLAIQGAPVTIKQIELAIIERAFSEGWVQPQKAVRKTGCRVAIIGSGPAGLAAGQQLCRKGHEVTIFERSERPGGLLRYGVPDFKLEKAIIDRRLQQMIIEGVRFRCGVNVGVDVAVSNLRGEFDAVLVAIGSLDANELQVPGRNLAGVHQAMDYLTQANKAIAGEAITEEKITASGKSVLVIGAGDTASDCIGTANRQGAVRVLQFSYKKQPQLWNLPHNPEWPEYPLGILHETSSHQEGCERDWDVASRCFIDNGSGAVSAVECERVRWCIDEKGRRMEPLPGTKFRIETDLVLLAIGFKHPEHLLANQLRLDLDQRGNICQANYATSAAGVFVAGDAQTGASLVVHAMHHGRDAAESIDNYLQS